MRRLLAPIALAPLLVAACSDTWAPDDVLSSDCARTVVDAPSDDVIVRVDGNGSFLGDRGTFIPRGIGSYPLLEHAGNGRIDAIDDIFDQAITLGRPLVRTNAFLDGGRNAARIRDDDGTLRDEGLAGLDALLDRAAARGVRLVLVLTNHWPDYGGGRAVLSFAAPGEHLPIDAFYSDARAIDAQVEYVRAIVSRVNARNGRAYGADPTVFAWELVNEARCEDDARCDETTLVRWARTMAEAIRGAGAQQLVAWGGAGHTDGVHGEDLAAIAEDGAVDVLTLHVYPGNERSLDLADATAARPLGAIRAGVDVIERTARIARAHRRALLVEELGWLPSQGGSRDGERGLVIGAWLRAARRSGVGALPWMIGEHGRPDYDGHLVDLEEDDATAMAFLCE